jgi:hypothetical protein
VLTHQQAAATAERHAPEGGALVYERVVVLNTASISTPGCPKSILGKSDAVMFALFHGIVVDPPCVNKPQNDVWAETDRPCLNRATSKYLDAE